MWTLLLFFTLAQIVHGSCPPGYELIKDGECRGYQDKRTVYFNDAARIAIETCEKIQGQPPIIHDEEHQSYWKSKAPSTYDGFLVLGIVCNTKTKKYEWMDGTAINYKPTSYNPELNKACSTENSWDIHPDGYWGYATSGSPMAAFFYCTTQLEQPTPGKNGCDSFSDDEENGVCFQVGAAAESWQDAKMACKKENDFVRRLAVARGVANGLFLGGTAKGDGSFGWIDGTKMAYDNFYPGFPKKNFGDCIAMDSSSATGQWMNVDCATEFPFACVRSQQSSPSEPTCTGEDYDEGAIITSPGYPFSASTACDYFLTAPAGKKVQVEIISLEANSCCDSLVINDGYMGGNVIAKLTGSMANATFVTKASNIMRVSWQPQGGVNVKGVAMTYRVV